MKKNQKKYLILLIIFVFLGIIYSVQKEIYSKESNIDYATKDNLTSFSVYNFFKLNLQLPVNWEKREGEYSIMVNQIFKEAADGRLKNLSLAVSYLKEENPEQITIKDLIQKNDFNSSYQDVKETKNGNLNFYTLYNYTVDQNLIGYFQPIEMYLGYDTDVYRLDLYEIPDTTTLKIDGFSEEDIKLAQEYEKIVDEIIQSIHFVE